MKLIFSLLLTLSVMLFGAVAMADTTIIPVTTNSNADVFPQIGGNYVVWQGRAGANWEIFLYDMNDSEADPIRITNNDYDDMSPYTDGESVVWVGFSKSGGEIFLYRIDDSTPGDGNAITNDTNIDSGPQIANGRVVWTSHQVGDSVEPGEIILYEVGTQTATTLSALVDPNGTLDDSSPRIDDTDVMWVQADGSGNTTLFVCDLTKRKIRPKPAPEGFVWEDSPQTDGNLTVLSRYDGNDREIFLYDSNSTKYHQITDNGFEDRYPRISGNYIAWIGGQGQASDIFLAYYDATFITLVSPDDDESPLPKKPKKPPATFSWDSVGYDKFKIQFSGYEDFSVGDPLTFPGQERKWLSGTSFTPRKREWSSIAALQEYDYVYWRVRGKDAGGNEDFSEVRSFFAHHPSLDTSLVLLRTALPR